MTRSWVNWILGWWPYCPRNHSLGRWVGWLGQPIDQPFQLELWKDIKWWYHFRCRNCGANFQKASISQGPAVLGFRTMWNQRSQVWRKWKWLANSCSTGVGFGCHDSPMKSHKWSVNPLMYSDIPTFSWFFAFWGLWGLVGPSLGTSWFSHLDKWLHEGSNPIGILWVDI